MKRLPILSLAVCMTMAASGCCGMWPCGWHAGAGYGGYAPGGACPPAGGSVSPSTYPSTGWYGGTQPQVHQVEPDPVATAPASYGGGGQSAQVPLETLPTYH